MPHRHRRTGPAEVRPQPLVLAGQCQEDVLLVAVAQPRQAVGKADHELFDAAENAGFHPRIDADLGLHGVGQR